MAFALQLQDSLRHRDGRVADEFAAGDSLETVLGRHLLAVEASAVTELTTSILLLDETGTRLSHGAAPNLPEEYCEAINGVEIGPNAGSCGTAAFTGRAIYVTDIATDPLWVDYRDLALPHGLRACWSTPILDSNNTVIGTFAIYHPTPRSPTPNEVEAIRLITDHVAQAILWSRGRRDGPQQIEVEEQSPRKSNLKLVAEDDARAIHEEYAQEFGSGFDGRLKAYATSLDRYAGMVASQRIARALKAVAADCRKLVGSNRTRPNRSRDDQ